MATVVPMDDYSPILQGDTGKPLVIQVLHINGPETLTGTAISMSMQNVDNPENIKVCNGPWNFDPDDSSKAFYQYQDADVDTPGSWLLWIKILINGRPVHPDDGKGSPKILVIEPLPSGV
jgi:hypothetical protein